MKIRMEVRHTVEIRKDDLWEEVGEYASMYDAMTAVSVLIRAGHSARSVSTYSKG